MNKLKILTRTRAIAITIAVLLLIYPQLVTSQQLTNNQLIPLSTFYGPYDRPSTVWLNQTDRQLWQKAIDDSKLDELDKRVTTQLLPKLAKGFSYIAAQTLFGYDDPDNQTSRLFDGAKNTSQRALGKATNITAIGTTSCATFTRFARGLDPQNPLWLHYQNPKSTKAPLENFFGRSFDAAASQSFWLEGRAFTNALTTPDSWSDFMQQIAKGEIEQQFGLAPGSLQKTAVSDLVATVGQLRLASSLGLNDLPAAEDEEQFYSQLGQWQVEQGLSLPRFSLEGENWREIYQTIGFRVLEDQLINGPAESESPFGNSGLTLQENDRFLLLAKQLQKRALIYADPRRALNLPAENYLPTAEGRLNIYDRLTNGDPDAFAIAGAYYLAEGLNLAPNQTAAFIQSVERGEDRPITLADARPIDDRFQANQFFSAGSTEESRQAIFTQVGRTLEASINSNLGRLNEIVLLAISGSNRTPSLQKLMDTITDPENRDRAYQKIGDYSAKEADYTGGFTIQELKLRGELKLAETLNLSVMQLRQLDAIDRNSADPEIKQTAFDVDYAMGWPEGTALIIARQEFDGNSVGAIVSHENRIRIGGKRLLRLLGLTDEQTEALLNLYIRSDAPTTTTDGTPSTPTTTTTPRPSPSPKTPVNDQSDEDTPFDDEQLGEEVELFSISPQELPFAGELVSSLRVPSETIDALLAGRLLLALPQLTLAALGQEMAESSTITSFKLIDLYLSPTLEGATAVANQKVGAGDSFYGEPGFFEELEAGVQDGDSYRIWLAVANEVTRQWNITCPDKQVEAEEAITKLIESLIDLPPIDGSVDPETTLTRPAQILTAKKERLSPTLLNSIPEAYPGIGEAGVKWGVYSAPRAFDHIYIGY